MCCSVMRLHHSDDSLQVFETLGPVASPYYSVRFNTADEIVEKGIQPGMSVFFAPSMTEYTHYVFLAQLQQ